MAREEIQVSCEHCGRSEIYSASDAGTVQECRGCGEYFDVPDEYALQAMESDRQLEVSGRQQAETERQLQIAKQQQEQFQRQLDRDEELDKRQEQLLDSACQLLGRWENLADRLEKVVNKIESKFGM